ncbi:MAG TPA: YraN family protein [Gammaproteobacteria bacterium]|nr:YraN family protein [Gammaproteobacteria bacterium]
MAVEFKVKPQGNKTEAEVCIFLQKQGLQLLHQNYRCSCGEIDLIMQDLDEIVFIEVRLRRHSDRGTALESVDKTKQRKIIKTALLFLQKKQWLDILNCRFDVVGMNSLNQIEWIKNAFSFDFI